MAIIDNYLLKNYVLVFMILGMLALSAYDVFLRKDMIRDLRITIVLVFLLSVFDSMEAYFGNLPYVSMWRYFFSAVCYSLRPIIIMMIVFIVYDDSSRLIMIPAIVNVITSFSCFFTGIVYSFTEDNHFERGPLGYTPYLVSAFYIIGLVAISIRVVSDHSLEESLILFVMAFAAVGAALFGLLGYENSVMVNHSFGACIVLYYLYTYSQFTKRDALTGLLNRQSYYGYIERSSDNIRGVISIDMNELKWLNDNLGHEAGDKGLTTVSRCFKKNVPAGNKVYRIGGDEFMVLCNKKNGESLAEIVDNMRKAVDESGYSCAFGYSEEGSIDDMIRNADKYMYEDKAKIKAGMKDKGVMVHFRED